jgi:hypothetical protein
MDRGQMSSREEVMRIAFLLVLILLPASVCAQPYNPFTPRLDQLPPPPGTPICDPWYREQALPKLGCTPDLIAKICSGQIPKVYSGSYCGGLAAHNPNMGKTCKTTMGECPLNEPAPLKMGCYCMDAAQHQFQGYVSPP